MKYDTASVLRHAFPNKPLQSFMELSIMATSIATPVKQQIAHYRLTPAIIGRELKKIFPGYDVRAFAIKASTTMLSLFSTSSYDTNSDLGSQRCVQISSAGSSTDRGANPPPLTNFSTNVNQDEKDKILACRVGDPKDDWN